jgi:hypothetical protein
MTTIAHHAARAACIGLAHELTIAPHEAMLIVHADRLGDGTLTARLASPAELRAAPDDVQRVLVPLHEWAVEHLGAEGREDALIALVCLPQTVVPLIVSRHGWAPAPQRRGPTLGARASRRRGRRAAQPRLRLVQGGRS